MEAVLRRQLPVARGQGIVHEVRAPARISAAACRAVGSSGRSVAQDLAGAQQQEAQQVQTGRRAVLGALLGASLIGAAPPALAIQGATAGRIPGVSSVADEEGFFQYQRPEGKSGGHGVGWSEIPRYKFRVPAGWEETPVSIADLGGTEIDLRFASKEGSLSVVVAPILRFKDVGYNAAVRIDDIGPPDQVIAGFAPELFGQPLDDNSVLDTKVYTDKSGLKYYAWEVKMKQHTLTTCTAVGNRVFILTVTAKERPFQKHRDDYLKIASSFSVPVA